MKIWQNYLAELLGTFILVFMGTTGIVASNTLTSGNVSFAELVVPFGFGLALLAGLYAFAEVSGGHFNPAARERRERVPARGRLHRNPRPGHPAIDEELPVHRKRPRGHPADAGFHPCRGHPILRSGRQPGADSRAGAHRQQVGERMDLLPRPRAG